MGLKNLEASWKIATFWPSENNISSKLSIRVALILWDNTNAVLYWTSSSLLNLKLDIPFTVLVNKTIANK